MWCLLHHLVTHPSEELPASANAPYQFASLGKLHGDGWWVDWEVHCKGHVKWKGWDLVSPWQHRHQVSVAPLSLESHQLQDLWGSTPSPWYNLPSASMYPSQHATTCPPSPLQLHQAFKCCLHLAMLIPVHCTWCCGMSNKYLGGRATGWAVGNRERPRRSVSYRGCISEEAGPNCTLLGALTGWPC